MINSSTDELSFDRAMIEAIRCILGLSPLYEIQKESVDTPFTNPIETGNRKVTLERY